MKHLILVLTLLNIGCGSGDGDDTHITIAAGDASQAGDPITENSSGCAESDDGCGQNIDN